MVWIAATRRIAAVGALAALLATDPLDAAELPQSAFALEKAGTGGRAEAPGAIPSRPKTLHPGPLPEFALAERLISGIPNDTKVALQPLTRRYAGLAPAVGDPLYERLLRALANAADGSVMLLARERLHAIYDSWDEFHQGDIASLLRNAQADVEIFCKPTSNATGITLSCSAVSLAQAVTLATAAAHFPISHPAAHFDVAIESIATRLAEGVPPGKVALVPFLDTGVQTTLTRHVGRRLEDKITTLMAERSRRRAADADANAALRGGSTSGSDVSSHRLRGESVPRYRLRGELRRLDDERFRVDARMMLDKLKVFADGEYVAVASVPARLAASLTRSGEVPAPTKRYEAVAEAVLSERLDVASARRGARNLARARVIAQALGLDAPAVDEVRSEADAVAALGGYLGKGLPVEEQFHDLAGGDGSLVGVHLGAKVVPVGVAGRPAVTAKLSKTVFKALEPISIELRSEASVYLGVFGWGADNKVVRLYPRPAQRILRMEPGQVLVLPSHGEGRIRSEPLPMEGNLEDHEALIVVAASQDVRFADLAPPAGETLAGTMRRARDGDRFIEALVDIEPGRMAVVVLGYQVHL